jgi:Protein of unknown function (DUF3489)
MKQPAKPAKPATGAKKGRKGTGATARPTKQHASKPPAQKSTTCSQRPDSKLGIVIGMLRSTKGVTIEALAKATGWQAHSVRGAISGAIKKKHGLTVTSEKIDGVRTYRIID